VDFEVFLTRPAHSCQLQVALKNGVGYSAALGVLKDARAKGLTVPVLLMGS
jgi:hypothetical protein